MLNTPFTIFSASSASDWPYLDTRSGLLEAGTAFPVGLGVLHLYDIHSWAQQIVESPQSHPLAYVADREHHDGWLASVKQKGPCIPLQSLHAHLGSSPDLPFFDQQSNPG